MTPKQEAKSLIESFDNAQDPYHNRSIDNAIIAVDRIISLNIKYHGREIENNFYNIEYWQEVKKELEKRNRN